MDHRARPAPVPNGEADAHARFSPLAIAGQWQPATHHAHLLVTTSYRGASLLERTRTSHRLIAAVAAAAASNAVGVYIGEGGVTHQPAFYVEAIASMPDALIAWCGVSVAREGDRLSLLSTGMRQLQLPDVQLTAATTSPGDAMLALYDLLAYIARRGERLPEGDTVGASAHQRVPVRYVPSPVDESIEVMRVDYP